MVFDDFESNSIRLHAADVAFLLAIIIVKLS